MEATLLETKYRFIPPKLSPFWVAASAPIRAYYRRVYRLRQIEVRGEENLARVTGQGHAVLVHPNHPAHGDGLTVFEAGRKLGMRFYYMATRHVFEGWAGLKRLGLRRLGLFSVDREGTDLQAFRQALEILAEAKHPLVIFPEGEVYHINDRVTPLREGAAMIALTRAKRAREQKVFCVPCGMKYFYLRDPRVKLTEVMTTLEKDIHWRPQLNRSLPERIYKYAQAALALKEQEYLDRTQSGTLPERIKSLMEAVLSELEGRHFGQTRSGTVPERVKELRRHCLERLTAASRSAAEADQLPLDLEDLLFVIQLFSYPGEYVAENPTIERIAETLQKFEEDALGVRFAPPRAPRKAVVEFGEPIDVGDFLRSNGDNPRRVGEPLTNLLEERIQDLLDGLSNGGPVIEEWADEAIEVQPARRVTQAAAPEQSGPSKVAS